MKLGTVVVSIASLCMLVLTGCTTSVRSGDAILKMKRNLFNTMIYWLDSPSFCVGETNSVVFQYRDVPTPTLPEMFIVERTQGRQYAREQRSKPAYLPLRVRLTCLDTNGREYFRTIVDFSSITRGNVWPHAQAITPSAAESDLKTSFDVKVDVLSPSERRHDRAYLHTTLYSPDGYQTGK